MLFGSLFLVIFSLVGSNGEINSNYCGLEIEDSRIIGGSLVPDHKYPWMAFVVSRICGQYFGCGGSVIDERHILTAAHCVDGADKVYYRVGSNSQVDYLNETSPASCYFVHDDYTTQTYQNDMAIIRTKRTIQFSDTVLPVCVPPRRMRINQNKTITLVGWGVTENYTTAEKLMETEVNYYNFTECNDSWDGMLEEKIQFCASDPGHGPCFGDSGGPAMQKYNYRHFIFGVASFVQLPCAAYRNSVYGYVPGFYDWIQKSIRTECPNKSERLNLQRFDLVSKFKSKVKLN